MCEPPRDFLRPSDRRSGAPFWGGACANVPKIRTHFGAVIASHPRAIHCAPPDRSAQNGVHSNQFEGGRSLCDRFPPYGSPGSTCSSVRRGRSRNSSGMLAGAWNVHGRDVFGAGRGLLAVKDGCGDRSELAAERPLGSVGAPHFDWSVGGLTLREQGARCRDEWRHGNAHGPAVDRCSPFFVGGAVQPRSVMGPR